MVQLRMDVTGDAEHTISGLGSQGIMYVRALKMLKPGSHLCDKHNTSDISISISTRKKEHVPFFLCLCLCLCSSEKSRKEKFSLMTDRLFVSFPLT